MRPARSAGFGSTARPSVALARELRRRREHEPASGTHQAAARAESSREQATEGAGPEICRTRFAVRGSNVRGDQQNRRRGAGRPPETCSKRRRRCSPEADALQAIPHEQSRWRRRRPDHVAGELSPPQCVGGDEKNGADRRRDQHRREGGEVEGRSGKRGRGGLPQTNWVP